MNILLVEDSPSDQLLAREALSLAGITNELHVVDDGVAAMAFLRGEAGYEHAPRPDLILLDLNLPRMDGRELLAAIKGSRFLQCIPVVVLSTSSSETDVARAYELQANCFVSKPIDFEDFKRVVATISDFWLKLVRLPGPQVEAYGRS